MTEKRFKMKKLEYESYFIDSQQEYVDEDEPELKIGGEKTMSDSQILELLNENERLKSENENLKITIEARDALIKVCEKKFRELGYIITVDDDGYVIE